jgi:FkbM family methyltransferase
MTIDIESYVRVHNMPEHIKWEWSETVVKIFFNCFSKVIPPGDAIDLGANFGIHSWNLGNIIKKTDHTIISVEPDRRCYQFLNDVFSKGNFKYVLIKNPISDLEKSVKFCFAEDTQLNSIDNYSSSDSGAIMHTVTLDNIAYSYNPKYIKIDVEGQDINVIKGGQQTIKTHRPIISTEYNLNYTIDEKLWYYDFFKDLNYTIIDFLGNEYDREHWLHDFSPYWNRFLIPSEYQTGINEFKINIDKMFQHHGMENLIK